MITRGYIIGKIVDDLAGLKYQVETRNRLQLFDLTKFSEDFFKDLLNIIYNLNLNNLNNERTNTPGIDLGDDRQEGIAYQITATKTSQKVNGTLRAITEKQKKTYKCIRILIIGEKQNSYSIEPILLDEVGFDSEKDIVDIDDLLKDIIVLDTTRLDEIFTLFKNEFRQLRIELEPVDKFGHFESSLYNTLEVIPNKKPINANKLRDKFDDDINLKSIKKLYKNLSGIPRVTRELLAIITERGKFKIYNHMGKEWGILPQTLKNLLKMNDNDLMSELAILEQSDLIYYGEDDIGDNLYPCIVLKYEPLNEIVNCAKQNDISLKRLFNTMDFTVLDE